MHKGQLEGRAVGHGQPGQGNVPVSLEGMHKLGHRTKFRDGCINGQRVICGGRGRMIKRARPEKAHLGTGNAEK